MQLCLAGALKSAFGIISRSHSPLLGFLYQTRTIQSGRFQLSIHPTQIRRVHPRDLDDIPFESMDQIETDLLPEAPSTITNREREAFRKLFDGLLKSPQPGLKGEKRVSQQSEKARKAAHADAQHPEATDVLEAAVRRRDRDARMDHLKRFPAPLRRMAAAATQRIQERQDLVEGDERLKAQEDAQTPAAADPLVRLREDQYKGIEQLLLHAPTDYELWNVLEKKVFSVIQSLHLDDQETQRATVGGKADPKLLQQNEQLAILGPNFPSLLLVAVRLLRANFPTSIYPFQIIPAIKNIGRGSYVLGASTPLYNEVMAATWEVWSNFNKIDELLREMDNAGLEFDDLTLDLLKRIRREGRNAMAGRQGEVKRLWSHFEIVENGWTRVCEWIPEIQARQQALAVRLANEKEMQREQLGYEQAEEREDTQSMAASAI